MRWDALLARETARELDAELAGAKLRALRLDGHTRAMALLLEERTLTWALHPHTGWPRLTGPSSPSEADFKLKGRVVSVSAVPDERIVRVELSSAEGRARALVVELLGNQWNALFVEGAGDDAVVRHVLVRRDGKRPQRVGEPYRPPRPLVRTGVAGDVSAADWLAALEPALPSERAAVLVRTFAWTSPLNAAALVGDDLARGYALWQRLADPSAPTEPVVLELAGGPQPYPIALHDTPHRQADSLLAAFAAAASVSGAGAPTPALDPSLLDRLHAAAEHARGRTARLEAELAGLEDPAAMRARGDLILARYGEIAHGATRATLMDFDGRPVDIELDPARPAHDNAAAYYQRATKSERAAERLPGLIAEARAAWAHLEDVLARARAGTAEEAEVRAALPKSAPRDPGSRDVGPALPYRVYRSSGGLEIRVGRGSKHNDDLTFHHSSPGDVWLHARHVGGAHVILRWPGPGNPPARDLAEAATLAALHSKARTSSSVPVDWTFRKYVRKPRKAPPGRVTVERVETLFVRPDVSAARALADVDHEPLDA